MRLPQFIFDFINSYFRLSIGECKRVEGYLVKTVLTNLCENSIWHNLFPVLMVPVHTNEALSSPKYQLRFNSSRLIPCSTRLSIISVSDMAIISSISDIVKFVFIVLFKSKQSSNASKWILIFKLQIAISTARSKPRDSAHLDMSSTRYHFDLHIWNNISHFLTLGYLTYRIQHWIGLLGINYTV